MSKLTDAMLAVSTPPTINNRLKTASTTVEIKGNEATVEFPRQAEEDADSAAYRYLRSKGEDPANWVVTGFRSSEWTMPNGEVGESMRYTFARKGTDAAGDSYPIDEVLAWVDGHHAERPRFTLPSGVADLGDAAFTFAVGDQQFGKALKDDTPMLTANRGWTTHGDIVPGDLVFGADGKPKKVLAVTGSTEQELYEVEFGDGSVIVASGDHLWSGVRRMHPTNYRRGGPQWEDRKLVLSTRELAALTERAAYKGRPFIVDAAEPVQFPEKELPIEPHLLGLWLGDGNSHTGTIAKGHQDADLLLRYGNQIVPNGHALTVRVEGLTAALCDAGLLKNKHVPQEYLAASVEQRLALVQGLMDSDGFASAAGDCEFSNTNEQIVQSMAYLLRSLGMRPVVTEHVGRLNGEEKERYWRVRFRATLPVFTLERKAERVRPSTKRLGIRRAVRRVTPVGTGSAQCLTVEGGLYLAGAELIVTHNCDGDGVDGTLARSIQYVDEALCRYVIYSQFYRFTEIVLAFMGDHGEGFVSQNGANIFRTSLTNTEQQRLTRRVMAYTMERFAEVAPLAAPIKMVAVPGNHGDTYRPQGKGVLKYNDSYDTEALVAVADAARMSNRAELERVEFYVPGDDEIAVVLDVANTRMAFAHGHYHKPGRHFEWLEGQALDKGNPLRDADVLIEGHLHHYHVDSRSGVTFIGVPAVESESTWFRHRTGITGDPGSVVAIVRDGRVNVQEVIR